MSYCKSEGKDRVIFVTEQDHKVPSKVPFPDDDEEDKPAGLILPDGEINWACPCLGGMATGPCGVEFRDAFSCFHFSKADPKGSDCLNSFRTMSECMSKYPKVYSSSTDDDDNDIFTDHKENGSNETATAAGEESPEENLDSKGNSLGKTSGSLINNTSSAIVKS